MVSIFNKFLFDRIKIPFIILLVVTILIIILSIIFVVKEVKDDNK